MADNTTNSTTGAGAVAVTVPEEKSAPVTNKEKDQKSAMAEDAKAGKMKYIWAALTISSYSLSFLPLGCVIFLLYMGQCDCENLLQLLKVQVGIIAGLIIIFFLSNIVVYFRTRYPLPGLIFIMVPLISILMVGLALVGAYKIESRLIPGSPLWLEMNVNRNSNWNNIKACIYDTRTCKDLVARSYLVKSYEFATSKLSPIESGCCKPPMMCDMVYENGTYWRKGVVPPGSDLPSDVDCDLWTNDPKTLCYNCHTCKQGFIETLQEKWWKLGVFLVVMTVFLITCHVLLFIATTWEQYAG